MSTGMTIRGIFGWPMLHGEPLLCNDPQSHRDRVGYPEGHVPINCFLGIPLKREVKVVGMVAVANKPGGYTEEDQETLERLAAIMSASRQHREALIKSKRTSAELEASNKELEAFAYSVSHDLRTPLRSMDGFSLALLEDYSDKVDEQGKDYLRRVRGSAQRMASLIEDLLKLSRVTRKEMKRQEVSLSSLAWKTADELRESQPGRDVEIVISKGLQVTGDTDLIRVVLENLLGNAWKFTSKQAAARIELGTLEHKSEKAYFVRDNGVGFDMQYANKLFGAFERLHSANEFGGTGIGLATVQRIIHRHGGRVWGEGEVGKGATFYFTI
jgi:light-regulated signal transduction histidine kinase (bacteriophytochrome)